MDLRDRFAAHFAAALVDAFTDGGKLAQRAYDLADAMLEERARRFDAGDGEPSRDSITASARPAHHLALLDEPEPMMEMEMEMEPDPGYEDDLDPRWLDPPYDPSWDLDARWSAEPAPRPPGLDGVSRPPIPGPGLARTQPEDEEARKKERSA
jgi:hypothetical protein